jgi:DNA polymerase III delta subunit
MSESKPNIVLVSGNEYDVNDYLDSVTKRLKNSGCEHVCKIYSDSCDSNHIIEEIMSSDIFGTETLYVIKDLPEKDYNNMISAFANIPPENYVIFYTYKSFKKYKKFTKGVLDATGSKNSIIQYSEDVKDMKSLAATIIAESGKKISGPALSKLVSGLGSNAGLIKNEISKLINYIGDSSSIELADVENICWTDDDFIIWDLLNALSAKNISSAMKALAQAFRNGTECEQMLFMINRALKLSILIKDCQSRKLSEKEIKAELKKIKKKEGAIVFGDYEISKTISNRSSFCNSFTLDQLYRSFYSVNQGFLKIRSVYDPGEKEREMSLLLYAVCYPNNVIRVYDKEVSYVQ